jgi:hypothetical protein
MMMMIDQKRPYLQLPSSFFLLALSLLLSRTTSNNVKPVENSAREKEMDNSLMIPPWQATNPTNLNPLGLPPEKAAAVFSLGLRGGAYPSGRAIASEKFGLIDNPQNAHVIGPNFGHGGTNSPTDRPRFYPKDFLTDQEPSTVTPPKWFHATDPLFNPNKEDGFTPGELEPVHPVPCSIHDSDGSGLCNEAPKVSKSIVDQFLKDGPVPIDPPKPLGKIEDKLTGVGPTPLGKSDSDDGYSTKSPPADDDVEKKRNGE